MKKICVNEDILKIIAVISMTIDHSIKFGLILDETGLLRATIGRLAFPIFGFLIMKHFSSNNPHIFKKYLLRLGSFGVLTTALLMPFGPVEKLNILFTFLWPILFIKLLQYPFCMKQASSFLWSIFFGIMAFVILTPVILITDYWFIGFFYLIALYSWFRFGRSWNAVACVLPFLLQPGIGCMVQILCVVALLCFNSYMGGKRLLKKWWLFYLYYPIHLLVLRLLVLI